MEGPAADAAGPYKSKSLALLIVLISSITAFESCPKPCTEVSYTFDAEPFTANTVEDLSQLSRCSWLEKPSLLALQFSRRIQLEYVSCQSSPIDVGDSSIGSFWLLLAGSSGHTDSWLPCMERGFGCVSWLLYCWRSNSSEQSSTSSGQLWLSSELSLLSLRVNKY